MQTRKFNESFKDRDELKPYFKGSTNLLEKILIILHKAARELFE